MFGKPNVYADFSAQTFSFTHAGLSEVLRSWLETYPDRVLFGTDAFSFGPAVDWPGVGLAVEYNCANCVGDGIDGHDERRRNLSRTSAGTGENGVKGECEEVVQSWGRGSVVRYALACRFASRRASVFHDNDKLGGSLQSHLLGMRSKWKLFCRSAAVSSAPLRVIPPRILEPSKISR